jgi:hypothetical protein
MVSVSCATLAGTVKVCVLDEYVKVWLTVVPAAAEGTTTIESA